MTELEWPSLAQPLCRLGVAPTRVPQLLDEGRIGRVRTSLGRLVDPAAVERLAELEAGP